MYIYNTYMLTHTSEFELKLTKLQLIGIRLDDVRQPGNVDAE